MIGNLTLWRTKLSMRNDVLTFWNLSANDHSNFSEKIFDLHVETCWVGDHRILRDYEASGVKIDKLSLLYFEIRRF